MVFTNVVQDAILYLNMKNQHMLQKFPYPNNQYKLPSLLMSNKSCTVEASQGEDGEAVEAAGDAVAVVVLLAALDFGE